MKYNLHDKLLKNVMNDDNLRYEKVEKIMLLDTE